MPPSLPPHSSNKWMSAAEPVNAWESRIWNHLLAQGQEPFQDLPACPLFKGLSNLFVPKRDTEQAMGKSKSQVTSVFIVKKITLCVNWAVPQNDVIHKSRADSPHVHLMERCFAPLKNMVYIFFQIWEADLHQIWCTSVWCALEDPIAMMAMIHQ